MDGEESFALKSNCFHVSIMRGFGPDTCYRDNYVTLRYMFTICNPSLAQFTSTKFEYAP